MFVDLMAKLTTIGIVVVENILDCFVDVNDGLCNARIASLNAYGVQLVEWVTALVQTVLQSAMANAQVLGWTG